MIAQSLLWKRKSFSNNRMHSDSKKRRSSFLVALLFAAGDAKRYGLSL
jgi:hypothetical protein